MVDLNNLRMPTLKLIFVPRSATNGHSYGFALAACRHSQVGFIEESSISLRTCQPISLHRPQVHTIRPEAHALLGFEVLRGLHLRAELEIVHLAEARFGNAARLVVFGLGLAR